MPDHLTQRAGIWHFARRVPQHLTDRDRRGVVKFSTKIRVADDPRGMRAARVAARLNADLEAHWRALAAGEAPADRVTHAQALARARSLGVPYYQAAEIADLPEAAFIERLRLLKQPAAADDPVTRAALLGAVAPPAFRLSEIFDEYALAVRAEVIGYSAAQRLKWEKAKRRALEILIEIVGDKPLGTFARADAIKFVDHWQARIDLEGVAINTANKNIDHIAGMIRRVIERRGLKLDNPFAGLRLKRGKDGKRPAYSVAFIRDRILAPGALDALNDAARAAVHVLIETGARPSEIVNLKADRIHLDAPVPYIAIRPDARRLKTESSARDIPLVGIALAALRAFPSGFARYADNESSFSAAVGKFLREHGLRETPAHTVYSLRHTFKDRLREIAAGDELTDVLMGHAIDKPDYGGGFTLDRKAAILRAIAFDVRRDNE